MPGIEIDKQIDQLLEEGLDTDSQDEVTEEWKPPVPEYAFIERAQIADVIFGPDAKSTAGEETLARRIQTVADTFKLCQLRDPPRRGKPFNWNKVELTAATDAALHLDEKDFKSEELAPLSPLPSPLSPRPSSDQCSFCFFDDTLKPEDCLRPYACIDSLRRHVLQVHLNQASRHDYSLRGLAAPLADTPVEERPIICLIPACDGLVLQGQMAYKYHAARVHKGSF